jgi:hypothetical protein
MSGLNYIPVSAPIAAPVNGRETAKSPSTGAVNPTAPAGLLQSCPDRVPVGSKRRVGARKATDVPMGKPNA